MLEERPGFLPVLLSVLRGVGGGVLRVRGGEGELVAVQLLLGDPWELVLELCEGVEFFFRLIVKLDLVDARARVIAV